MIGNGTVRIPHCKADVTRTRFKCYHEFPTSDRSSKTGNASCAHILAYRRRFLKACGEGTVVQMDNHRAFVHRLCLDSGMSRWLGSGWFDEDKALEDSVPLRV